jgi:hypothetical protein
MCQIVALATLLATYRRYAAVHLSSPSECRILAVGGGLLYEEAGRMLNKSSKLLSRQHELS